ncbi:hydrophobin family protein [Streptomyces orinoci]|uniref:Hydrophobin family protein n=1 Tax=Streptomyces orinoci TaxID=67339 RepID=A0ABV3JTD2_STRON|nr:hydrophobin family protein [Streptomyces orinoci]
MARNLRARVCTVASALVLAASATITTITTATPASAADQLLCCDQAVNANNSTAQNVARLVGADLSRTTGTVGVQCHSLDPVGPARNCGGEPLVCAHNNLGILATGCRPFNVNR